jgi:hypothetical protein
MNCQRHGGTQTKMIGHGIIASGALCLHMVRYAFIWCVMPSYMALIATSGASAIRVV